MEAPHFEFEGIPAQWIMHNPTQALESQKESQRSTSKRVTNIEYESAIN